MQFADFRVAKTLRAVVADQMTFYNRMMRDKKLKESMNTEKQIELTEEEKKAALRFCETCEDGEGYDVPKPMMKRLKELGLVVHKGGGWYEGTPALEQLQGAN